MIAWSTARYRWRTLLGSFVALALGIGLLASAAIVIASAKAQPDPRYSDAEVLVAPAVVGETSTLAERRLPWTPDKADRLVDELSEAEGVRAVAADLAFPVEVLRGDDQLSDAADDEQLGHNWSSRLLGDDELVDGVAPTGAREAVVPDAYGVEPGDRVALSTPTGRSDVTVAGTSTGSSVYVADQVATRWSTGSGAIGLVLEEHADETQVAEEVRGIVGGDASVLTGADRSTLENAVDRSNRNVGAQLLSAMGVMSSFVSVFVVATTFAFVVSQRRREIGLLRAIGATPRQVRRMLLGEAVVVGVVGSLVGAVLGLVGAPLLGRWMVDAGMQARDWEPTTIVVPLAGSVLTGITVAFVGVLAASRRAARTSPLQVLRESSVEHRAMTTARWVVGVLAGVLGIGLAAGTPTAEGGAVAGLAVGAVAAFVTALTLLAPLYLPLVVRLLCPGRATAAELARAETAVGVRRIASLIAPVLVTVAFTVTITGMTNTMEEAFSQDARSDVPTDRVVVPDDESVGVSDATVRAANESGARVAADLPTGVVVGGEWHDALGSERIAVERGAIAVSAGQARDRGWADGDRVRLSWADGRASSVRVIVTGDVPAPITLDRRQAREHDPAAVADVGYLDTQGAAGLADALSPTYATVEATGAYESADNADEGRLLRLFVVVLLGLSMGFTALAIANTMLMATGERRSDFGVLRMVGATGRQIRRYVGVEAVIVVLIGSVLGIVVAVPALYGIAAGLGDDLGFDVAVAMDWRAVAAVVAGCLTIAVAAGVLPARARTTN
ncbi:ABC transporter permease [Solicola gregarius]|uniref:FtsX-like permease family protein n=1 Tax=Solicola gregarius TaxID=2908642 RepID=A0AA46TMF4_9ACTN|nr:FtsX-like permease family protein [Solicola gregarius]UYM07624.1 FtsX-like permease family protein [Solicola gregarius]